MIPRSLCNKPYCHHTQCLRGGSKYVRILSLFPPGITCGIQPRGSDQSWITLLPNSAWHLSSHDMVYDSLMMPQGSRLMATSGHTTRLRLFNMAVWLIRFLERPPLLLHPQIEQRQRQRQRQQQQQQQRDHPTLYQ